MVNGAMKILFVDDESWIRDIFCQFLAGSRYEVITAESAQEALDILSKHVVDIMFLDLGMPVVEGQEALEIATKKYPHIPVVITTKHGDLKTAVECLRKGAYDFIAKPFQVDQLLLTIKRTAEKRELEQRAKLFEEELARALLDLNTEKKRLKTIMNSIADGLMVTDRSLEVILHNPALLQMLGAKAEVKNPFPVTQIIDDGALIATLKKILCGETSEDECIPQEIHVGENILRAKAAPLLGPDRTMFWSVVGTVTVFEDMTPYKRLAEMESDFVNMVVHELRSPLMLMKVTNDYLLDGRAGPLEEKQKEFVSKGTRKIDALLDLIDELLDLAKIGEGKYVQPRVPTDIGRIIEEIVALMEVRAKEQEIILSYACENLKPLQADPKSIEEVLSNLIANAINYSPDGGRVTVTARITGDHVEITVEDTGVGIPPEELPKIFDKFYRVKHPKTRQVRGSGLGLSIVKGIVEAYNGSIDVKSIVNEGTTFRITLPMTSAS